jgi:hypothetical protein
LKRRHLILLMLMLSLAPMIVTAQPITVIEHDWTVRVGAGRYGLRQCNMAPGDLNRWTTVYVGGPLFNLRLRAGQLIALILVPVIGLGAFAVKKRDRS